MAGEAVPEVQSIDQAQWKPKEYDLLCHFVNFAGLANSVVLDPGPLRGWFSKALWRQYSYAPFNARVMENYYSLAFFYGYEAPWNIYYKHRAVLERLEAVLHYTFNLMREDGALPEYAPADLDSPMLAPSSFGAEYMAASLEMTGQVLPGNIRQELVEHARKAALYALASETARSHAKSYTNQYLGAMVAAAKLGRLAGDGKLRELVERSLDLLLDDFISPMGFLYEADGADTFGYFFVSLGRLISLYRELRDRRVLEVLRRHCAWMSRWMLPEPDGEAVFLSTSHQTRTKTALRLSPRRVNGLGELLEEGADERRFLKLFLVSEEARSARRRAREEEDDSVASYRGRGLREGYRPVPLLSLYPPCSPPEVEIARVCAELPCPRPETPCSAQGDDRGNQFVFVRVPGYYVGFAHARHRTAANHGPGFLWTEAAGTVILGANGERGCWETRTESGGTGKATALAEVRRSEGTREVVVQYDDLGMRKAYVLRDAGLDVLIRAGGKITEYVPLILRDDDRVVLDYGSCPVAGIGSRHLGAVSRKISIERRGEPVLTFDFGSPVSAKLTPAGDLEGYVQVDLSFSPANAFFGRTGYRVHVE